MSLSFKCLLSAHRLDLDPELLEIERGLDMHAILALRILYGCLTYLDEADGPASPVGSYGEFLERIDEKVRQALNADDTFEFLERVSGHPKTPRSIIILINDFDAPKLPQVRCSLALKLALVSFAQCSH